MRCENWGTKQERPTVETMLEGRERQRSGARGKANRDDKVKKSKIRAWETNLRVTWGEGVDVN